LSIYLVVDTHPPALHESAMAQQYNSTALIVDDNDPAITYSSGWVLAGTSAEYDDTRHGATAAGQTATFTFTGIGIEVYGSQGSIDVFGQPVTTYSIDGVYSATYQAPVIAPGYYTAHTLFYRSPPLTAAQHTLVITNTNGTAPSEYWLDYIIYTPSNSITTIPTTQSSFISSSSQPSSIFTSSTSSMSSPTLSQITDSSSSTTLPGSAYSGYSGSTSLTGDIPSSSTPSAPVTSFHASSVIAHKTPVGAIAGGVVGGALFLLVLLLGLYFYRRSRKGYTRADRISIIPDDTRPFTSWRNEDVFAPQAAFADVQTSMLPVAPVSSSNLPGTSNGAANRPGVGPSSNKTSHRTGDTALAIQHADSGIRLPPASIDIPPPYSDDQLS